MLEQPSAEFRRRTFAAVFLLAFAVRAALLPFVPRGVVLPRSRSEVERVAMTLVRTGAYADPYVIPTGPTAHPLPVHTALLAIPYRVFGLTLRAGYASSLVHIAGYAAVFALLPWLGMALGLGARAGLVAGIAGAALPLQGMDELVGWMGTEALAAVALGLLLVACVRRWSARGTGSDTTPRRSCTPGRGEPPASLALGIGWGAAFHLQPALLPVMLGCLAFETWWARGRGRWAGPALVAAGAALACLPWGLRNYAAFHEAVFVRANFGLELRLANHDGTAATWDALAAREGAELRHPGSHLAEATAVRDLGEAEYMRRARAEAVRWIRTHPGEFLRLTARRVAHFWLGPLRPSLDSLAYLALTLLALLGAWRVLPVLTVPRRAALLVPLATFPLVYYVIVYMARYRAPMDWLLFLLAGAAVAGRGAAAPSGAPPEAG